MQYRICGTIAVVAATSLLCAVWQTRSSVVDSAFDRGEPRARLSVPVTAYDLGHTRTAKQWQVAFPVRNLGTRRLVLNQLDQACGCGDRVLRTIVIAPDGTTDLSLQLDTRSGVGRMESVACYATNDPLCPRLELKVQATIGSIDDQSVGGEDGGS